MTACERFELSLMEGDAASMDAAATHARTCAACAETWETWNDISAVAPSLRMAWSSDTLWPRIAKALNGTGRTSPAPWWRVAAAVLLAAMLATGTWYAMRVRSDRAFDAAILRDEAMRRVDEAERSHVAAIEQLEKLADPKLEDPATPLMVSYKEKLLLLDDAIAECQTVIEQNRQNANVRKQLLAIYTEKQRTLQDVLREGSNASNQ